MAKKRDSTVRWFLAIILMSMLSLFLFLVPSKAQAEKNVHHEDHYLESTEETPTQESHESVTHENHSDHHSSDEHAAHKEGFNAGEMIMHHIGDANAFHIVGDIYIPLPVIIYNKTEGSWFTGLSTEFYLDHHGNSTNEVGGFYMHHGRVLPINEKIAIIDFSITKNVFTMLLSSLLLIVIFTTVAKGYRRREGQAPKGIQGFFEPIVIFIRDQVARPFLGKKTDAYMPFLLTLFFFIWSLNLLGLIPIFPGSANVTGNIMVCAALALIIFVVILLRANKDYWKHILMPDLPLLLYPIVVPIEVIGIFTKPFALMVRLFANIAAGHIIILSLVSLVFIFGNSGESLSGGITGGLITTVFGLFMNVMELLVAAIQAFIFTNLSAVFIGLAIEDNHEHAEHH
ncbi:MAG: F0F1 ATP synthase subunit A [Bacteroidota bacterium]|nr:F0F1 ATP synthase subunit A [Bacteroidota bacterium]